MIAPNSNVSCARLALFGAQVTAAKRQNKQKWRKKKFVGIKQWREEENVNLTMVNFKGI